MPIQEESLIRRLQSLAPFEDERQCKRAFDATLQALRAGLNDDAADWMAVDLGPALAEPLQRQKYAGELSLSDFYRQVGRQLKLRRGAATERAQVVCCALAESLPAPAVLRLTKHLPALASLFCRREAVEPVVRALPDP